MKFININKQIDIQNVSHKFHILLENKIEEKSSVQDCIVWYTNECIGIRLKYKFNFFYLFTTNQTKKKLSANKLWVISELLFIPRILLPGISKWFPNNRMWDWKKHTTAQTICCSLCAYANYHYLSILGSDVIIFDFVVKSKRTVSCRVRWFSVIVWRIINDCCDRVHALNRFGLFLLLLNEKEIEIKILFADNKTNLIGILSMLNFYETQKMK